MKKNTDAIKYKGVTYHKVAVSGDVTAEELYDYAQNVEQLYLYLEEFFAAYAEAEVDNEADEGGFLHEAYVVAGEIVSIFRRIPGNRDATITDATKTALGDMIVKHYKDNKQSYQDAYNKSKDAYTAKYIAYKKALYVRADAESESLDGHNLHLYIRNTQELYNNQILPIFKHLLKFKSNRTYSPKRAVDALLPVMAAGAKRYMLEVEKDRETPYHERFTKAARRVAAQEFLSLFDALYQSGEIEEQVGLTKPRFVARQRSAADRLDDFCGGYLYAALWSSTDDNSVPLDKNYTFKDVALECMEQIAKDCTEFQEKHLQPLLDDETYDDVDRLHATEYAGADFWLTRNETGAGFGDGDWPEPIASILTKASEEFGPQDLYVGDDGKIYCYPPPAN